MLSLVIDPQFSLTLQYYKYSNGHNSISTTSFPIVLLQVKKEKVSQNAKSQLRKVKTMSCFLETTPLATLFNMCYELDR